MLLFGSGQVDITPPEPLPLGGYTARNGAAFEPGGEPLFARARTIGDVALVSVEMLTVPESLVAAVRAKSGEQKLFMVATHTHCAPDSQMLNDRMTLQIPGIASFRRRWLEWYSDRIVEAIRQARASQTRPISMFDIRQVSLPYARSRRPLGVPDNWATKVDVRFEDGGAETLLTVFAAHPTLYDASERKLRGDWPGQYMTRSGGLVFTGAIGDVSPVPEVPSSFARAIWRGLDCVLAKPLSPTISFSTHPIELAKPVPHPTFASTNGLSDSLANSIVAKFAPSEASITGLQIDDFLLVGVPGEPTSELGRSIRQFGHKKGLKVAVASHVNGWIGYILSAADYARGGYEAQLSMHGPETGNRLVDAARRVISRSSKN